MDVQMQINGEKVDASVGASESLLVLLRDKLNLPGSKNACEQGECGSCTVILDGRAICSCLVMAADAQGAEIATVEGVADGDNLHAVQSAMIEGGAVQCGFCTPGIIVAAVHLLESNPVPTTDEIKEALSGNICRCTGYSAILRSLETLVPR